MLNNSSVDLWNGSWIARPVDPFASPKITIWTVTFAILGALGQCGLLVLLLTILISPRKRQGVGAVVLHVTSVQTTFVLAGTMFLVDTYLYWTRGMAVVNCKHLIQMISMLAFADAWLQLVLAVNRVIAIVYPTHYATATKAKVLGLQVAFCWFVALCCTIPGWFGVGGYHGRFWPLNACNGIATDASYTFFWTVGGVVPVNATGAMYMIIYRHIKKGHAAQVNMDSGMAKSWNRRRNMTKILFLSFFSYVAVLFPSMLCFALSHLIAVTVYGALLSATSLCTLTYAVSPIFFFALSHEYREGAVALLHLGSVHCRCNIRDKVNKILPTQDNSNKGMPTHTTTRRGTKTTAMLSHAVKH